MKKIIPFLWFDLQAEEAAKFYVSVFSGVKGKKSRIVKTSYYGEAGPRPAGTVLTVHFQLCGEDFIALNGGPEFKFTEAISLSVDCKTQAEVDNLWKKLTEGGEESMCGWLKDKYGLSWQVNPGVLGKMLSDKNAERAKRVMQAMLQMKKIDISKLKEAYKGT